MAEDQTPESAAATTVAPQEQPPAEQPTQQPPAEQAPAGRRRLKRSTRIALSVILVVALIAGGWLGVSYLLNARRYVSTDNAQIDGDRILVNAPATGTLLDWRATVGTNLHRDQVVGRIQIQGGFAQPQMAIRAPADGTVAVDNGVIGTYVTTGTQLAVAYDLAKIYVTARVDESGINDVHVGRQVDIDVDAYPGVTLTGYVQEIQGGAAGVFSLFPQSNTTGNFQKVTQVIPVRITLVDWKGLQLVPGMNVVVRIHKH